MEYTTVIDVENNVVNYHPVLTEEEKEEINQEFLRYMSKLFAKYESNVYMYKKN